MPAARATSSSTTLIDAPVSKRNGHRLPAVDANVDDGLLRAEVETQFVSRVRAARNREAQDERACH